MKVGIYRDGNNKLSPVSQKFQSILSANKIETVLLSADDEDFWQLVKTIDLFIYRRGVRDDHTQIAENIIPIIETHMKIKCLPDLASSWSYDNKIRQYYLSIEKQLPMIKSWIFWDKEKAISFINCSDYPIVSKLKGGAGSRNVVLLKSKKEALKIVNAMFGKGVFLAKIPISNNISRKYFDTTKLFKKIILSLIRYSQGVTPVDLHWNKDKDYAYFQKFLPNNDYDTRVTIIGKRAFAFRRFNRPDDFRSSGSGNVDHDHKKIDLIFVKEAFKVSKKLNAQTMAYDFIYNGKKPEFCEMSYTYHDSYIHKCPGYWDEDFNWHKGHYWPQYLQLLDCLNNKDLIQPYFSMPVNYPGNMQNYDKDYTNY